MTVSTGDRELTMERTTAEERQPDAVAARRDEREKFDELRERCPSPWSAWLVRLAVLGCPAHRGRPRYLQ